MRMLVQQQLSCGDDQRVRLGLLLLCRCVLDLGVLHSPAVFCAAAVLLWALAALLLLLQCTGAGVLRTIQQVDVQIHIQRVSDAHAMAPVAGA